MQIGNTSGTTSKGNKQATYSFFAILILQVAARVSDCPSGTKLLETGQYNWRRPKLHSMQRLTILTTADLQDKAVKHDS